MTTTQLIEHLKQYPPNADVLHESGGSKFMIDEIRAGTEAEQHALNRDHSKPMVILLPVGHETGYEHWQSDPPWVVCDEARTEFLIPRALRYCVVRSKENEIGRWFIGDRFEGTEVSGTSANSREQAIKNFYIKVNRKIPDNFQLPDMPKEC